MTASNHVVTGALIAASVPNPVLGLTLALLSHLALDVLPHFGVNPTNTKVFVPILITDCGLAATVLLSILWLQPPQVWIILAGGVLAASPDLTSLTYFLQIMQGQPIKPWNKLKRFLSWIQWSETVPGIAIELVWFLAFGSLLLAQIT